MTRVLFLLRPVLFGGLCLLWGETLNWLKKNDRRERFTTTTVLHNTGRK